MRVITPTGMFGASEAGGWLDTALRVISVGFGHPGDWNSKYGAAVHDHHCLVDPHVGLADQIVARILVDVCEVEDRTSPDEAPEMMLVSGEELDVIVRRALEEAGVR